MGSKQQLKEELGDGLATAAPPPSSSTIASRSPRSPAYSRETCQVWVRVRVRVWVRVWVWVWVWVKVWVRIGAGCKGLYRALLRLSTKRRESEKEAWSSTPVVGFDPHIGP